ncbi:hypothetical protein NC651_006161 [Populus alba x Populus x berolinensis]|nr:hypothetical protein NC651_006161 [Populus alba x Populus x berolinensis]
MMVNGIVAQTWEWHTVISGVDNSCPVVHVGIVKVAKC